MSINFQTEASNEQRACLNKITKLKQMLALNRNSQVKLTNIRDKIEKRRKELEQIGVLEATNKFKLNPIFDGMDPINQVKKMPNLLEDQLLLKRNFIQEYGFLRNMIEEKQTKAKKIKKEKFDQLNIANLGPNPRAINFVEVGEKYGKTGLEIYKQWRQVYRSKPPTKIIGINEARLVEKRKIYGDNWEKIGYFFNGLSFENLYYYYQKNLSKAETGKWTLRQNLMLIVLVEYYGAGKWALISKKIKVKSQFQIRQRFCNILDPSIKQNKWTEEQEKLLLHVASEKGYKWSNIVKTIPQFSNKTDNALRRKFRNLMIKFDNDEIRRRIKNKKLEDSIIKFKSSYYNRAKKPLKNPKLEEDAS